MLSQIPHLSLTFNKFREDPKSGLRALARRTLSGLKTCAKFLKSCYVDGFRALIEGRYSRRQAAMIIAGTLPTILGTMMITVPSILFPSPGHQAFYHFGNTLGGEPASLIPVAIGAISSTLGLRIPLG
ncbi:hypothetical protein [Haloferula sp.]|uniref:hypothetical protein n=1 Tax=Haloferula sp. TaxID=2497595 RepID=UPI00329D5B59